MRQGVLPNRDVAFGARHVAGPALARAPSGRLPSLSPQPCPRSTERAPRRCPSTPLSRSPLQVGLLPADPWLLTSRSATAHKSHTIPPELVPIILGHLGCQALQNLSVFSHVCRDWYFFTRPLLFQRISFKVQPPLNTLQESSHLAPTPYGPLTTLLEFLEHSPAVSRHVQTLRLAALLELHRSTTQFPDVDPALLVRILLLLPSIETLELSDVLFHPEHYEAWRSHHVPFAGHLKRLDVTFPLRAAYMASYDDALRILEPFTGVIDELRVGTLYALSDRVHNASPPLRVRSIAIDDVADIDPFIRFVKQSRAVREGLLRDVCLSWVDLQNLRAARTLLECVKSDLEHFGCQIYPLLQSDSAGMSPRLVPICHALINFPSDKKKQLGELFRVLDFSDFPSLRALTLGIMICPGYPQSANVLRDVGQIVASLPVLGDSKSMVITLQICQHRLVPSKHIASVDWAVLDEILLSRCTSFRVLPSGKHLGLSTHAFGESRFAGATQARLVEWLPQLARAGKLIV